MHVIADRGKAMDNILKRTKTGLIITGIALTLLGIVMFMNPIGVTELVILMVGWIFLILGIVTLIDHIIHRKNGTSSATNAGAGIIEFILGLCILIWPGAFVGSLCVIFGIVVTLTGIGDVAESFSMRKIGGRWGVALILGILTIIFGILVIIAPFAFALFAITFTGVVLVFDGITEIVAGIMLPSR